MDKLDTIIAKLDNIATSINGTGNTDALATKYEDLATQLAYINTLEETQEAMRTSLTNSVKNTQGMVGSLHHEFTRRSEDYEQQVDTISDNISDIRAILRALADAIN
jgi:chaperonin cofactor prefoldin